MKNKVIICWFNIMLVISASAYSQKIELSNAILWQISGKPTQIDPLPPNQTDPPIPFQTDPLIPAQTDPLKRG